MIGFEKKKKKRTCQFTELILSKQSIATKLREKQNFRFQKNINSVLNIKKCDIPAVPDVLAQLNQNNIFYKTEIMNKKLDILQI